MSNPRAEENNGFGPIFELRKSRSTVAAIVLFSLYIVFVLWFDRQQSVWSFYQFSIAFSLLAGILGEAVRRSCLLVEELSHVNSRYDGSLKKAMKSVFAFKNTTLVGVLCVMALVLAAYLVLFSDQGFLLLMSQYSRLFWLNAIFIPTFVFLIGLREPSDVELSQLNEQQHKNLADGLAWSYYFGYLRFVLPELTGQINITKQFRYKIIVPKLFIILPKNCYVFDKISNADSDPTNLVRDVGNLEPLLKNRGGIQDRVYKHTVHSITDEKTEEQHFCVMEYATPLMTLHDMSEDKNAGLSREERDHQVTLFVRKLTEILDGDKDCKDKYELITYGQNQEIGKIMISALKDSCVEMGQ